MLSLSRGIKEGDLLGGKLTEEDEANGCGERERETLLQEEYKHISSQQTAFHRPRSSTLHHTGLQAKQR